MAGSFGTRETEITRETDLTQVEAVCLSCRNERPPLRTALCAVIARSLVPPSIAEM